MRFPTLSKRMKFIAGGIGGLALAGVAVGATAAAAGARLPSSPQPAVAAIPAPPPAPAPSPAPRQKTASAAQKAVRVAVLAAEAKVLGLQPRQLTADLRQGTTLQQLASAKGLDEAGFETQLAAELKPLLDQQVQGGVLTAKQEQRALARLAAGVPHWSQAGH